MISLPARRRDRLLLALGSVLAAGLVIGFVVIPWPWGLASRNPDATAVMDQRRAEARRAGETLEIRQEWVPLERISDRLERAVIVAEDWRFREHGGVDWQAVAEEVEWTGDEDVSLFSPSDLAALWRAFGYAWSHRSELRGRSTITQQLAKNLYFGTDRSFLRKALELVVAKRLERRLSKDRILELYLNTAEFGPGIFGVEAAARRYFGVSADALSRDQAAALASTLPHPLTSNPAYQPARMLRRKDRLLARLESGQQGPLPVDFTPPPLESLTPVDPAPAPDPLTIPDTLPGDSALLPDSVRPDTIPAPGADSGAVPTPLPHTLAVADSPGSTAATLGPGPGNR